MKKSLILKKYLGTFFINPSSIVIDICSNLSLDKDLFIISKNYLQFGTVLLLKDGRKNYIHITSSRVIDIYLSKDEEYSSLGNISNQFLVVTASSFEMENKRRWEILATLVNERRVMSLPTLILADKVEELVKDKFKELGFIIVDKGTSIKDVDSVSDFE